MFEMFDRLLYAKYAVEKDFPKYYLFKDGLQRWGVVNANALIYAKKIDKEYAKICFGKNDSSHFYVKLSDLKRCCRRG